MAKSANDPTLGVRRLSLYLRQVEAFLEDDRATVSSRLLGQAFGLSDPQVRKDRSYFGQFGYPGVGRALASYRGFLRRGLKLVAVFNNDEKKSAPSPVKTRIAYR